MAHLTQSSNAMTDRFYVLINQDLAWRLHLNSFLFFTEEQEFDKLISILDAAGAKPHTNYVTGIMTSDHFDDELEWKLLNERLLIQERLLKDLPLV